MKIVEIPTPVSISPHKRFKRYTLDEKIRILELVEKSPLLKTKVIRALNIPRSSYYKWLKSYKADKYEELMPTSTSTIKKKVFEQKYIEAIFRILHSPPKDYGFNRINGRQTEIYDVLKKECLPISLKNIR